MYIRTDICMYVCLNVCTYVHYVCMYLRPFTYYNRKTVGCIWMKFSISSAYKKTQGHCSFIKISIIEVKFHQSRAVPWLCRQSLASDFGGPNSLPQHCMWDFWQAKWHSVRFSPKHFGFLFSVSFHQYSVLIHPFIHSLTHHQCHVISAKPIGTARSIQNGKVQRMYVFWYSCSVQSYYCYNNCCYSMIQ